MEETDLEVMRTYFRNGGTREASWRKKQLQAMLRMVRERETEICQALNLDLGKPYVEAYRDEIGTLIKSLNYAISSLKGWMSRKKAKLPIIAVLSSAQVVAEPLGLVLVFSSWNFPFGLSLEPLIGAIAAGNAVVLKPSELSPASSSLLGTLIPAYLDNKAVRVVQGGAFAGEQLLMHKWDKIFFTGSPRVGQIVMYAAAKHMTPVVMELGGKCPAVIDTLTTSWDKQAAVNRILGGKYGVCAGQACIAVDYILVEQQFASTLVEIMKVKIRKMFGENPNKMMKSTSRIVNKQHFSRLRDLLNDPLIKASIVFGGSFDEDNLFIEPTILLDPPLNSELMTDEIFGPLLPIITLPKIEDSIKFINARPKPLALYVFTKKDSLKKRMVSETSSGCVAFNDTIVQYAADTLPFGGVGESGFGRYHGKFSFDAFSHERCIVNRSFYSDFWFRFPPWNDYKLQLLEATFNFNYLSMVFITLGLKRSRS